MRSITHSKSDNIKTKLEQRKKKAIWFINIHDTKLLQILEKTQSNGRRILSLSVMRIIFSGIFEYFHFTDE